MFKILFLIAALPLFVIADESPDFETLMGKGSKCWQYVQTKEDKGQIAFFKRLYEKNISYLQEVSEETRIPKVLHFIWLGSQELPESSKENIHSWIEKHPGWLAKFWTDIDRPLPCEEMTKILVTDSFKHVSDLYYKSDNVGEKAALLRYEILLQEGGVYIDHDVKCLRALDPLNSSFDFYCSLEKPAPSILSTSIYPAGHVIATVPAHQVLAKTFLWLLHNWERLEKHFPGTDPSSIENRVMHRVVWAFQEGIKRGAGHSKRDIVFPSSYFQFENTARNLGTEVGAFAMHMHERSWVKEVSHVEKSLKTYIKELERRNQRTLLIALGAALCNILGIAFLFWWLQNFKRAKHV